MFHEQVTKKQFYRSANQKIAFDKNEELMQNYFEHIRKNNEVPLPQFAKKPLIR